MTAGNDDPVRRKLRQRGVAEYIIQEGAEGLVRRWRHFVDQVEKGYPLGLDDYRNDLDIRSLIALAGLEAEVSSDDARLRRLLTEAGLKRPVWESETPGAFWVRGIPRNVLGDLRDDLISEGLISG
jgi:hypothetical protein